MKKMLKKWLNSQAYQDYCMNMIRMYSYNVQ